MGRKSIAPQRRQEILDAFEVCIKKYGFNQSSTHQISKEAGLKQPMVAHYFGNKKALVDALVQRIMHDYESRMHKHMENETGMSRLKSLLDFLFGSGILGDKTKRQVLIQILAAAVYDVELHLQIQAMYQSFSETGIQELQDIFLDIPVEKIKECMHGIMCLAVGNDLLIFAAFPYSTRKHARQCAENLISDLSPIPGR